MIFCTAGFYLRVLVTVVVCYHAVLAFQHQQRYSDHMIRFSQTNRMATNTGGYYYRNLIIMMEQNRRENHFELHPTSPLSLDNRRRTNKSSNKGRLNNIEMTEIEKEVRGSTNAKLDMKRVVRAIDDASQPSGNDPDIVANTAHQWQLGLAAATTASIATLFVTNSLFLAATTFCCLFVVAVQDPNTEEGVAGPLTRLLGRTTIKSVEKSKPKLRAVVQAAITDNSNNEEYNSQQQQQQPTIIAQLQEEIKHLKAENASLRLWKEKRIATELLLDRYTPEELKRLENQLPSSIFNNNNNKSDYWNEEY